MCREGALPVGFSGQDGFHKRGSSLYSRALSAFLDAQAPANVFFQAAPAAGVGSYPDVTDCRHARNREEIASCLKP